MKFIEQFVYTFKKDLKAYFFAHKLATTQIYYKSEVYSCTDLKLPVVVFTIKSIGEVVQKCRRYSFAVCLDLVIYTECQDRPMLGIEIASLLVNFLTLKYSL
ncbi:hypothetical protein [Borrelia persica]|uniref:hypothetical protein n=1 Tax=Borrelia persica TaxID=44448 RepID=UPI0004BCC24C|nr:hypothetical protein [Borrelia persica]